MIQHQAKNLETTTKLLRINTQQLEKFQYEISILNILSSMFTRAFLNGLSRSISIRKIINKKKSLMTLNSGKVKFKRKFGSKFKNKTRKKIDNFTWAPCINMPEANDKAKQIVFIILFAIGKKEIK